MVKNFSFIVFVVGALFNSVPAIADNTKPPNIVLIVVDDLGWADVGYNDHTGVFQTPNIDALATKSIVYTDAYAGASNCAPSRAVLMSGQYSPRHGVYTVGSSERGNEKTRKIIPTPNTPYLDNDIVTMAEMLESRGYTTGTFGKWHLGQDPITQGFDHNVAGDTAGHPKSYFSPYEMTNLIDGPSGEYLPNRITSEAINWIKEVSSANNQQPFFAYIPYYTVHTPIIAIDSVTEKYLSHPKIQNEKHAAYAAMVELMDTNIGRIMRSLEQQSLLKDTLVIFTSDNGGIRSVAYQDPLRGGKGGYYEGGTRVPLLVSWPHKIVAKTDSTPVVNADFYPTLANIAGADVSRQVLDGVDLSSNWFYEKPIKPRALFWHFPIYLQAYNPSADQSRDPLFRTRPGTTMRKGRWKLHHYFEDDAYELYDLENDLGEHVNLAQYLPGIMNYLTLELNQWRENINAPVPTQRNPEFDAEFTAQQTNKRLLERVRR
ncbi:sulfatase [Alteromonas sp. KUL49]|uniref:sulfatase n=1 Tax=Alteromonas sp. KUL49 TaxID=2480798 RepID=UPI00102F2B5C|nr:sulfatase [Alteromonas sp. KUL49]TAP36906.1 aryl-sulfate sulfohydrolase [Alteromonas sp. KUL49]GEA13177.1 aryl-sulfate sulfohydrolase [Alteromonas sp. KUL49]